jgi:hypothetical protein
MAMGNQYGIDMGVKMYQNISQTWTLKMLLILKRCMLKKIKSTQENIRNGLAQQGRLIDTILKQHLNKTHNPQTKCSLTIKQTN